MHGYFGGSFFGSARTSRIRKHTIIRRSNSCARRCRRGRAPTAAVVQKAKKPPAAARPFKRTGYSAFAAAPNLLVKNVFPESNQSEYLVDLGARPCNAQIMSTDGENSSWHSKRPYLRNALARTLSRRD
ncbi:hypothetical protein EVAR_67223_1 [Eumeta japonica]|uniref:Uncharacterized protein n=1 Tax=Eumeta variegata TaxID=151549 RepID=A0A4C2A8B0_EUMVA|nr:hypothetical protein EVAR_67223_1 [Eumeta japonica]